LAGSIPRSDIRAWATLDRIGESEGGRFAGSMIDLSTPDLDFASLSQSMGAQVTPRPSPHPAPGTLRRY
jgi:hypothetical protein